MDWLLVTGQIDLCTSAVPCNPSNINTCEEGNEAGPSACDACVPYLNPLLYCTRVNTLLYSCTKYDTKFRPPAQTFC